MAAPLHVDIPHQLGREGAKRRLDANIGKLAGHMPGGAAEVQHRWEGDRMVVTVTAMGQTVTARADVEDSRVRAEIDLPALLGLFRGPIEATLQREGPRLLT